MKLRLRELVWSRANRSCEYCHMPQDRDPLPFGVDHIRPQYHHGATVAENLALACFHCNTFKGSHVAGYDPETETLCALYNPRRDTWANHFELHAAEIAGITPVGRTTVDVLRFNLSDRLEHRRLVIAAGHYSLDASSGA